ncbi:MAG: hypothetical protein ACLSVD_00125 [Eggerthellaceae bacterium]
MHKHGGLICAQPYYVHDWKPAPKRRKAPTARPTSPSSSSWAAFAP